MSKLNYERGLAVYTEHFREYQLTDQQKTIIADTIEREAILYADKHNINIISDEIGRDRVYRIITSALTIGLQTAPLDNINPSQVKKAIRLGHTQREELIQNGTSVYFDLRKPADERRPQHGNKWFHLGFKTDQMDKVWNQIQNLKSGYEHDAVVELLKEASQRTEALTMITDFALDSVFGNDISNMNLDQIKKGLTLIERAKILRGLAAASVLNSLNVEGNYNPVYFDGKTQEILADTEIEDDKWDKFVLKALQIFPVPDSLKEAAEDILLSLSGQVREKIKNFRKTKAYIDYTSKGLEQVIYYSRLREFLNILPLDALSLQGQYAFRPQDIESVRENGGETLWDESLEVHGHLIPSPRTLAAAVTALEIDLGYKKSPLTDSLRSATVAWEHYHRVLENYPQKIESLQSEINLFPYSTEGSLDVDTAAAELQSEQRKLTKEKLRLQTFSNLIYQNRGFSVLLMAEGYLDYDPDVINLYFQEFTERTKKKIEILQSKKAPESRRYLNFSVTNLLEVIGVSADTQINPSLIYEYKEEIGAYLASWHQESNRTWFNSEHGLLEGLIRSQNWTRSSEVLVEMISGEANRAEMSLSSFQQLDIQISDLQQQLIVSSNWTSTNKAEVEGVIKKIAYRKAKNISERESVLREARRRVLTPAILELSQNDQTHVNIADYWVKEYKRSGDFVFSFEEIIFHPFCPPINGYKNGDPTTHALLRNIQSKMRVIDAHKLINETQSNIHRLRKAVEHETQKFRVTKARANHMKRITHLSKLNHEFGNADQILLDKMVALNLVIDADDL